MLTEADVRAMKVAELKAELVLLDLPLTGKKDELMERLLEHLASQPAETKQDTAVSPSSVPAVTSVGSTAAVPSPILVDDEQARRLARASRFGIQPVEPTTAPQPKRAKPTKASALLASDPTLLAPDALQRRIERFGVVQPDAKRSKQAGGRTAVVVAPVEAVDYEQLKARQERFGVTTSALLAKSEMEEAKRRRMERFGPNAP